MKTSLLRYTVVCATALSVSVSTAAQDEKKWNVTPSVDLVSSYVWRGMYQTGPAFQPNLSVSVAGLSLSAWGSTDFGDAKEFDITLGYENNGFSIAVTDYWWSGQGARYGRYSTDHFFEGTVGYQFGESIPLSVCWNTMFAGGDKDTEGDQRYSTYIEAAYDLAVGGVSLTPKVSISPWKGMYHKEGSSGLAIPALSLRASKEIRVSEAFAPTLFTEAIVSPEHDNVFLIVGLGF